MSGAILIGFIVLAIIFLLVAAFIDEYNSDGWSIAGVVCFVIAVIMVVCIPISRLDSQAEVQYAQVFQETLDFNREQPQDFNVIERATVLEEINRVNIQIINWQVKGDKWYHNEWWYHPDTKDVVLVK
jgi:Na+/melibiose symporter-like transporter